MAKVMFPAGGVLEVICGPMFCGKTEEFIRRLRRAIIASKKVAVFTHKLDHRYASKKIVSHTGMVLRAKTVSTAREILKQVNSDIEIVAIDEAQWFGNDLINVCQRLLKKGHKVIVAGLATTYEGKPFPPVPYLMAIADNLTKLSAVCTKCGAEAVFHIKKKVIKTNPSKANPSLVGGIKDYEARCRRCFLGGR